VKLVIGNKNYSSWSLRPWLHLRESGIVFDEIPISLYQDDSAERIARFSPAGRVPVLIEDDGTTVWDSLAIIDHVRDHWIARGRRSPDRSRRRCTRASSLCARSCHSTCAPDPR
jgi:glutathione S-transferase